MSIEIKIDREKCLGIQICKECLNCPQAVFAMVPNDWQTNVVSDNSGDKSYKLVALYPETCTLCNLCIEKCPTSAITILKI